VKNILITGGTGLIGKQLVSILKKKKDINLYLIIRKKKFPKKNIKKIYYVKNLFTISQNNWKKYLINIDTVIHLAWYAKPPHYLNSLKNLECLNGTIKLAKACTQSKVKKFISAGTCFEYFHNNRKLHINSKVEPNSIYGTAKLSTYFFLSNIFASTKINFSWLRFFYILSKNDYKQKLVPSIINKLNQNKKVFLKTPYDKIDYLTVNKLSNVIVRIIFKKKLKKIYNICSGVGVTIKNIALSLASQNQKKLLIFSPKKKKIKKIVGIKNY